MHPNYLNSTDFLDCLGVDRSAGNMKKYVHCLLSFALNPDLM